MRKNYDLSRGKRGAVVPLPPGKTRITIRLDNEIIGWFRDRVEAQGRGNYQSMINAALREYVRLDGKSLENYVRNVVRDEIQGSGPGSASGLETLPPGRL